MAKIKMIYTCPKCEESTTAEDKPEKCGACGCKFPAVGAGGFVEPWTIEEQSVRIPDQKAKARFLLNLPIESASNIMNDALNIIQTIPGKKVKISDIRIIMGMAIQIGEIAKAYEKFLVAGGTHTADIFLQTGDTNELSATRNGEKTSAPKPTPLFAPMEQDE